MHIELIDLLRCPREHEETWLVAAFTSVRDRFVIEAKLGCPVCDSMYRISRGVADLRTEPSTVMPTAAEDAVDADAGAEDAVKVAAFLNLTTPGSLVVLEGANALLAASIGEMTESRVVALNPPFDMPETARLAIVHADSRIPLASGSVDAMALERAGTALIGDVPRVLRPGARLVSPASSVLPASMLELARDDEWIVSESVGPIVQLGR